MRVLSSAEILAAFEPHERRKVVSPDDLPWEDLDFLGWIHRSGHLGFVLYEGDTGLAGVTLERVVIRTKGARLFMCDLCCTLHEQGGLASFTRWNRSGTRARSYMLCADLKCSLYVRGKRPTGCAQMTETLGVSEKVGRLKANLGRLFEAPSAGGGRELLERPVHCVFWNEGKRKMAVAD